MKNNKIANLKSKNGGGYFKLNFRTISLIFILILIISLLGVSFSYWRFQSDQNDKNIASSKCFKVNITNESEAITLNNLHPITDEEGLKSSSYSFTIQNTCDTYAMYQVNLEDILDDTIAKRLNNKYIKISLNDGTPKVLNTYQGVTPTLKNADASFKLTSGSLAPKGSNNDSVNYNLKLWMDYDTPAIDEVMSATFKSKISVVSVYTEEENLNNEITIAYTSKDIEYSNVSETVEIIGESKEKDIIEYSEDGSSYTSVDIPSKKVTLVKTYNKEITPHIYFKDEVGNIKDQAIELKYLDQTGPTISLNKSNEWGITNTIDITLKDDKSGLSGYALTNTETTPSEWTHVNGQEVNTTETVYNNGKYYIYAKDLLENISHTSIDIDKIDDIDPVITNITEQSEYGLTSTITINAKDNETGLTGYSITSTNEEPTTWTDINNVTEESTYTYEASTNGLYYVWIKDGASHIISKSFNVTKVDTTPPTIVSITEQNNYGATSIITAVVKDTESGIISYAFTESSNEPTTWTSVNNTLAESRYTYSATKNGTIYFWVKDKAGNISSKAIAVTKVDDTPPVIVSLIEQDNYGATSTITAVAKDTESGIIGYAFTESNTEPTKWTSVNNAMTESTFTYVSKNNGTIYFWIKNGSGNTTSKAINIIKVDVTVPTVTLSLSDEATWAKSKTLTMNFSDNESGLAGYAVTTSSSTPTSWTVINGTSISKTQTITINRTYYIWVKDKVGLVSHVSKVVSNIDTKIPTVNMTLSKTSNSIIIDASGSKDGESGITKYEYSKDGTTYYSSTNSTYTFTGLSGGVYTIYLKVTDNAGNINSISEQITIIPNVVGKSITEAVTTLANVDKKNLTMDDYGNTRYIGANPNNYINVDGDMWRIIGVMKNIDNGNGQKQDRVKIIRASSIGQYSWDSCAKNINTGWGINEWSQADLMKLLNSGYEGESVGGSLYWNSKSGTCYSNNNNATSSCNFTSTGIKSKLKNLIGNVVWNTGSNGTNSYTSTSKGLAKNIYTYERSANNGKICSSGNYCNDTVTRTTTWTGKVGLMYPSDYGYATSGGSTMNRTACLNKNLSGWGMTDYADCANNNWLYSGSWQWTMSPLAFQSSATRLFAISSKSLSANYAYTKHDIRPVVYLLSTTKIQNGDGSESNPFILN